jgi:pyruvate-formate lyase-activating enzyme
VPVFEQICINANGDIVCSSCDVNGQRVYGNVFKDRIKDVYNGPMYQEMREWLLKSPPDTWCPAINRQCSQRATPATTQHKTSDCRVKVLRLEPVTYCNLECPVCPVELNFKQNPFLRDTRGHKLLPLATMLDVVEQLPDLELILYFNYGEPFLHKDTVQFLREVKRKRPTVKIVTNTNGLVMTPAQIKAIAAESLMDRVVFSIDGANPASYRKYRVGGDLSKALNKLMALVEACRAAGTWRRLVTDPPGGVQITWQYILFEWNDSDEELSQAKRIAADIGVPIEWVITCGHGASKRFLAGSTEAARLMNGSESFVHPTSSTDLANRIVCRQLKRRHVLPFFQKLPPCLVGIEACGSSITAHANSTWQHRPAPRRGDSPSQPGAEPRR